MPLTKMQRDLMLTGAIGVSVLVTAGGMIWWLNQPKPSVTETPATIAVSMETTPPEPIAEPEPTPEPQPEPEPQPSEQELVAKTIRDVLHKIGFEPEQAAGVARLMVDDDFTAWDEVAPMDRLAYCTFTAGKSLTVTGKDLVCIGILLHDYIAESYKEPDLRGAKPSKLISTYLRLEGDSVVSKARQLGNSITALQKEMAAREAGRVVKIEVLNKSIEYDRGNLTIRLTNESSESIPSLTVQVEMTLLGSHVGWAEIHEFQLPPGEGRLVEVRSKADLEQFDDYSFTLTGSLRERFALDVTR